MAGERAGPGSAARDGRRSWVARVLPVMLAAGGVACQSGAADTELPPNVQDPATLKTPSGAVARYRGALSHLGGTVDAAITAGAIITDELAALPTPLGTSTRYGNADSRGNLSGLSQSNSDRLHRLRAQAREARGFLAAYAPDSSPALQAHMYAVEGYAEVLLADLFCSGIPLSTVDFEGNYTLAAGSTTAEVYRHAAALFDSALALSADSVRIQQFAAVAKGRALLDVGEYAAAAAAVSAVPDDFAYQVTFTHSDYFDPQQPPDSAALWFFRWNYTAVPGSLSMADNEGGNGLDYRSSADPRTPAMSLGPDAIGGEMYFPAQYAETSPATFTLASGVEARLIEAEAALAAGSAEWLTKLNALRQTVGLADTTDPGTPAARVDLVFRERAFWLYLTGHRQGDLRRLIRNYPGHAPDQVYPAGTYPGGPGAYGDEIVIPTPDSERELNAKYTGCFHRNA